MEHGWTWPHLDPQEFIEGTNFQAFWHRWGRSQREARTHDEFRPGVTPHYLRSYKLRDISNEMMTHEKLRWHSMLTATAPILSNMFKWLLGVVQPQN